MFKDENATFNDSIDIEQGIAYLAGKKELYVKIVAVFLNGAENKIDSLKEFFKQEDFRRLVIEFHGLKSSSATVGSTLLPPLAQELENEGKLGNDEFIRQNFDKFIAQYEDTCKALNSAKELIKRELE
jgi:HPt (histidine-containing phosphotransfer) domain-containing protein